MRRANLSVPLPVIALVSRYLTNKLIGDRPLKCRPKPLVTNLSVCDIIRYYRPFRYPDKSGDAIPEHRVRYLSITNPFATITIMNYRDRSTCMS